MGEKTTVQTTTVPVAQPPTFLTAGKALLQRKCMCGESVGAEEKCEECKKKDGLLQRRSFGEVNWSSVPPVVNEVLRSSGQPLDPATRAFFEPRFGHDFSKVRIHTHARAAASARAVNAFAYTMGRDVVFSSGQYSPNSVAGQRLLAHELTHVVQQGQGIQAFGIGKPGDVCEREADRAADDISKGRGTIVSSSGAVPVMQRQVDPAAIEPKTPSLLPPPIAAETDEERLSRMIAESAREEEARRGTVQRAKPAPAPTTPVSEPSLAEAVRAMLRKCESEQRRLGEPSRRYLISPAPPLVGKGGEIDAGQELKRRIEACLDTHEGERVQAMAKDLLLSRKGAPVTITLLAGYLAYVLQTGKLPFIPGIKLGKEIELSASIEGEVTKPDKVMLTLKFKGVPSWLEAAGRALWGGVKSVGHSIWEGLKAVGGGIWSALKFVGRGLAAAGRAVWGGIKAVGRAIGVGAEAVGHGIAGAAGAVWEEIKAVGRVIGRTAEAVWDAVVAAGRTIGQAAEAVWALIKKAAATVGRTVWDFLGCLYEGGRGLLRRIIGGPYALCSFPSDYQKWLIPLGALLGLLWPGGLGGLAVGAVTGFLTTLLFHCFREVPGIKPRIGWARIPTKGHRVSGRQCLTGRLVRTPCVASDDGDINLHVAPCEADKDLVEQGNCGGEAEPGEPGGGVFVECELPYMLFEERFRIRPRGGEFVRICGEWVYDLGHGKKTELHPFDTLESASACKLADSFPACASAADEGSNSKRREGK